MFKENKCLPPKASLARSKSCFPVRPPGFQKDGSRTSCPSGCALGLQKAHAGQTLAQRLDPSASL